MRSGIYAIWNIVNNKIYVGQAAHIQKRWKNHRIGLRLDCHGNRYLQSAYNKYGSLNLIFYVIEYCEQHKLDWREQHWMDFYESYNREKGYNLSPTAGGSCTGFKHSEETKSDWSAQRKGKPRSEEAKAAIKAGWEKRRANGPVSEETKRKQSETHKAKNRKHTVEFKDAMSKRVTGNNYSSGSKRTPEHLAALAEGRRKAKQRRDEEFTINFVGSP